MKKFSIRPQSGKKLVTSSNNENKKDDHHEVRNPALLIFEDDLFAELFNARCHDTGEPVNIDKAKLFKDEIMRLNQKKDNHLNLHSLRLGVNSIISLSSTLPHKDYTSLNLSDNSVSDYGMHAVKNIITNAQIHHINLASNMISEIGLEMLVPDVTKNNRLKSLDLGITEGSIRKNSIGIQGAKCIAAILLYNKSIETLKLQDNDLGSIGGELIGAALKQNRTIKNLKISENELKSEGAEHILKAGLSLESLDIGKNYISYKSGPAIKFYIENNQHLKKFNIEFNELGFKGLQPLAESLALTTSLRSLNLKGNCIRDDGCRILADALDDNLVLEELDISLNEITPVGSAYIAEVLPRTGIKSFSIAKNFLGDDAFKQFADKIAEFGEASRLSVLDFSSCRIGDEGILYFLKTLGEYQNLTHLRMNDNFISEKIEKVLVEILELNKNILEFNVHGNRISLSCLSRIRKILNRNLKDAEEKEPNRLRTELYRLQYERDKILVAKDKIRTQEKEITKAQDNKERIIDEISRYQANEAYKRESLREKIQEQRRLIDRKKDQISDKTEELNKLKDKQVNEIGKMKEQYQGSLGKKQELEERFKELTIEKNTLEDKYIAEINSLKQKIKDAQEKSKNLKAKENALNEEFRLLRSQNH